MKIKILPGAIRDYLPSEFFNTIQTVDRETDDHYIFEAYFSTSYDPRSWYIDKKHAQIIEEEDSYAA